MRAYHTTRCTEHRWGKRRIVLVYVMSTSHVINNNQEWRQYNDLFVENDIRKIDLEVSFHHWRDIYNVVTVNLYIPGRVSRRNSISADATVVVPPELGFFLINWTPSSFFYPQYECRYG